MQKWVKITQVDDGFVVLTGYDERPSSTYRFGNIQEALHVAEQYLEPVTSVNIFVEERIGGGERAR